MADNEQEAAQLAKDKAARLPMEAAECVEQTVWPSGNPQELSDRELRRMENEKVRAAAKSWFDSYDDPHDNDQVKTLAAVAFGRDTIYWIADSDNPAKWESCLMKSINDGTHPRTAIFERYARMLARRRWQEVKDSQAREWDEAFSKAKADPEGTRVIVETNEQDPTAPDSEFGRYFMVDGSTENSCADYAGQWVVIRVDTVTSPYEVRRPNWNHLHNYMDNEAQPFCKVSNPNNVTRWAERMINAGRVVSIYADCY
jgi:hypothetical protein